MSWEGGWSDIHSEASRQVEELLEKSKAAGTFEVEDDSNLIVGEPAPNGRGIVMVPRKMIKGEWSPYNEDGTLRDLTSEGWHIIGAIAEDDLKLKKQEGEDES